MPEYKARRVRKRASGGKAGEGEGAPHPHMMIIIGLGAKKPKKKPGEDVEGSAARKHLGKRSRGAYADGGMTGRDWSKTSITNKPVGATLWGSREPMAGRVSPTPDGGNHFDQITNDPVGAKTAKFASGDPGRIVTAGPENRSVEQSDLGPAYPDSNPQVANRSGPPMGPDMSQVASRQSAPFRSAPVKQAPAPHRAPARPQPSMMAKSEPSADDLTDYYNAKGPSGVSNWEAMKMAQGDSGPGMSGAKQLADMAAHKRGGAAMDDVDMDDMDMPVKKKKKGGKVEGEAARRHLGKRARGGVTKRARGGRSDDDELDARDDSHDPEEDGDDKVSEGGGTDERAVEMRPKRMDGGMVPTMGMARGGYDSPATRARGGKADHWIQGAREKMEKKGTVGALHREMGVPAGSKIPARKLSAAKSEAEKTGNTKMLRRVQFAQNVRK